MATALTPAHRVWRRRVFIATYLSYVGYYFCRKPFTVAKKAIGAQNHWDQATLGNIGTAYLITYAIGQFLASSMGTRLGPRKNVLLGMGISVVVTAAMGITMSPWVMAGLFAVNGLAQATGWSGNVGTMAGWFHKHERGKVMGAWATNFNIGALISGWALAGVLALATPAPWQWTFFAGAAVLTAIWVLFYYWQRNRPEDLGLVAIDDPDTVVDESKAPDLVPPPSDGFMGLTRNAWINLMLVAGFYFFVKFIRYAIWSWAPYFINSNYLGGDHDTAAGLYATAFDLLGLPGVYLTGWLSDRYFKSSRAGISLIMMIATTVFLALMTGFYDASLALFVPVLALVGFSVYGPDALLTGAGAMDIGGRRAATFAAAVISGFGSMGSIVQELVISRVYDPQHDSLFVIFVLLLGSAALAAAFCAALVFRNRKGNGI